MLLCKSNHSCLKDKLSIPELQGSKYTTPPMGFRSSEQTHRSTALERKNKRFSQVVLETRRALTTMSENTDLHDSAGKLQAGEEGKHMP